MNSQDIQNLQESYLAVYDDETRETLEFGNWVNDLLDEGYDLSDYTWDELYETYIGEERAPGVKPYQPRKRNPLPAEKPLSGEMGDRSGYGDDDKMKDWKLNATPSTKDRKGRSISQRMNDEKPYKNRMMGELGRRSSRIGAEVDRVIRGKGEARATVSLAPKTRKEEFELWVNNLLDEGYDLSGYTWEGLYEEYILNEAYDLYDVILSHLINEGYADTQEQAEVIMVNMSEDWRESILDENMLDVARGVGKVAGNVAKDVKDRVTGKKELIGGPQGYVKVGGPSKPGDVKVSGIGPVGTYGKRTTPTGGNSPAATMSMRAR